MKLEINPGISWLPNVTHNSRIIFELLVENEAKAPCDTCDTCGIWIADV